jgi:hypothetical protein
MPLLSRTKEPLCGSCPLLLFLTPVHYERSLGSVDMENPLSLYVPLALFLASFHCEGIFFSQLMKESLLWPFSRHTCLLSVLVSWHCLQAVFSATRTSESSLNLSIHHPTHSSIQSQHFEDLLTSQTLSTASKCQALLATPTAARRTGHIKQCDHLRLGTRSTSLNSHLSCRSKVPTMSLSSRLRSNPKVPTTSLTWHLHRPMVPTMSPRDPAAHSSITAQPHHGATTLSPD